MITVNAVNKNISFTVVQKNPVSISTGGSRVSFAVRTGSVNIYGSRTAEYTHVLSQIDVDNKFLILSDLSTIANKSVIQIFVDNCGIKLEHGIDYNITLDNKILWDGYSVDGKLSVGDKIKVYY